MESNLLSASGSGHQSHETELLPGKFLLSKLDQEGGLTLRSAGGGGDQSHETKLPGKSLLSQEGGLALKSAGHGGD